MLCSPRLYEPVLPALWGLGPVTIADTRHDETIAGMAERALATVFGSFALIGLSMGGYVALEIVRQAPERVRALALLSTSARPDAPGQTAARREQLARLEMEGLAAVTDGAFPLVVAASRVGDAPLRETVRTMASEVGAEAFVRQQEATIARRDSRPALSSISCAALVLHGDGDRLIASENGRELAAMIPNAELVMLGDCGHSPPLEQPEATAYALTTFLASVLRD